METSEHGLTTEEAAKRLAQYGENVLAEGKKKSFLRFFFGQFADLLVGILIVAAAISACSGNPESTFVILVVIVLNALLGTIQYVKAEKSLESLKDLTSPNAKVLRSGVKVEIPAKEVVPGDLLLLEAGDLVAADGRIRRSYSLQVNESSLTGESTNVEKREGVIEQEAALGDRVNMVYSGSLVTYGRAEVFVTETAMNTEIGKIAGLFKQCEGKKTPLQIALDDFGKKLSYLILAVCALVFRSVNVPGYAASGRDDVCGRACSCGDSGSPRLDRDNRAGDGNPENGEGACDHQRSEGGGESGLCVGDLFG